MILEGWRFGSCSLGLVLHQVFDISCDLSLLSFVNFGSDLVHISLLTALHTCLQTCIICIGQQTILLISIPHLCRLKDCQAKASDEFKAYTECMDYFR